MNWIMEHVGSTAWAERHAQRWEPRAGDQADVDADFWASAHEAVEIPGGALPVSPPQMRAENRNTQAPAGQGELF